MFVQIVVGLTVVGAACDNRLVPTERRRKAEKNTIGEIRCACWANILLVEDMIEVTRKREEQEFLTSRAEKN